MGKKCDFQSYCRYYHGSYFYGCYLKSWGHLIGRAFRNT